MVSMMRSRHVVINRPSINKILADKMKRDVPKPHSLTHRIGCPLCSDALTVRFLPSNKRAHVAPFRRITRLKCFLAIRTGLFVQRSAGVDLRRHELREILSLGDPAAFVVQFPPTLPTIGFRAARGASGDWLPAFAEDFLASHSLNSVIKSPFLIVTTASGTTALTAPSINKPNMVANNPRIASSLSKSDLGSFRTTLNRLGVRY